MRTGWESQSRRGSTRLRRCASRSWSSSPRGDRATAPRWRSSRARTCAASRPTRPSPTSPQELFAEVTGAFDFAAGRGDRPILVRAFNPVEDLHGYERPGSVLETSTEDLPFLVDSVRAALAAEDLTIQRVHAPRRRPGARRGRPDHRRAAPARGERARVDHALRPRPPARRRRPRGARRHRPLRPRRRAPRGARLPRDGRPRPAHGPGRRRRRRPLRRRRGRRDGRLPRVAARRPLHLPRLPRVQDRRRHDRGRARLRARHPRRRGVVRVRPPAAARRPARRRARARAGGRPADRLQDEPALHGAPARADGLRRRPQGRPRRPRDRRGADARPVHHQGLRRAGLADAAAEPQAAPDPPPRGPDRGLARLQGRGHAVRLVPQGRAVLRPHRRPAPRGRRAALAGGRPRAAARPPLGRRPLRVAHRGAPGGPLRRRAARGASSQLLRERFDTEAVDTQTVLGEGERVRVHATVHAPDRRARRAAARPRAGADRAHPDVGGRPARAARRALRPGARARARRAPGARASPRTTAPRSTRRSPSADVDCFDRLEREARAVRRRAPERARTARASRSTRPAARSSWATRCRRSRTSGCASSRRSRRGCSAATATPGCRTSACSARTTGRSTSTRSATAWRTRSRPCGAATPSRTRSTGSCSSRG